MTALSSAALRTGPRTVGTARAVRVVAFGALALDAAAHWAAIVHPAAGGTLVAMLLGAVAAAVTADAARAIEPGAARAAAQVGVALAGLVAILLLAGVPAGALRPWRWPEATAAVGRALGALPALRMPYLGHDAWIHAVLLAGGGLLLLVAAPLALRAQPRSFAAAICLTVLYTVPIVDRAPRRPWLDGAVFALLLGGWLWGERLRRRELPLAIGAGAAIVVAAALIAPRLDSGSPWIDYGTLADSFRSGPSTTYSWSHAYGPLDWPRTGVELATVHARGSVYLKAMDLERFDGRVWRQSPAAIGLSDGDTQVDVRHPAWRQTIHVTISGLRSAQFLGAGTTMAIRHSTRPVHEATPGTFAVDGQPLRRGDSYDASVYVPRPSARELRAAGTGYPAFLGRQLVVGVPASTATGGFGAVDVAFPAWGSDTAMTASGPQGLVNVDPRAAIDASPYRRELALATRLRAASANPYDDVLRVIARVQRGARYTEHPPPPGRLAPLDAFLFRDHAGYCQHFAGATALLLRMGGVPARVAAGFSPGDPSGGGTHVIHDVDAHSWIEVYFPAIGWVTFDPTPGASPARDQLTDHGAGPVAAAAAGAAATPAVAQAPRIPGQARGRDEVPRPTSGGPASAGASGGHGAAGGSTLARTAVVLAALAAAVAATRVARRRRRPRPPDPELDELRRALERTGRPVAPDVTLHRLERRLGGSPEAAAYLRGLRNARYAAAPGTPARPTAAGRRALRRELGAGLGVSGRLRAAWALPPRPGELLHRLRAGRNRSYTP